MARGPTITADRPTTGAGGTGSYVYDQSRAEFLREQQRHAGQPDRGAEHDARLDRDAVIGLGDQPLERPVLERCAHKLEPVLSAGGRKLGGERQFVGHGPKMPRRSGSANATSVSLSKNRASFCSCHMGVTHRAPV